MPCRDLVYVADPGPLAASAARTPERPSIRLNIPTSQTPSLSAPLATPIPLSPIAFNIPGPRDLRRRREEELERRMKALGFVESPRSPKENAVPDAAAEPSPSPSPPHDRKFSISSVETDEDREVVLLVDHESDVEDQEPEPEPERERPPTRSQSRAAMLTLFSDDSDDRDTLGHPYRLASVDEREIETVASGLPGVGSRVDVDVEVEVVTKEAVARTKRRFSRKWIRERRGKRWTEQDFSEIIAQLRKLR
ncbi:hypothetical protein OH76DRAFT_1464927 [Lentinus brumalis]|uniref:Uncharacterized protein n=1 Tax=Lentinus brumalis TaxID=2498619 RepID=A0A371D5D2_9APHY|nr:hypothetical protein OH76DRAFT_1464927 [Polyporus brumalis]